jgi:hypothetical protein
MPRRPPKLQVRPEIQVLRTVMSEKPVTIIWPKSTRNSLSRVHCSPWLLFGAFQIASPDKKRPEVLEEFAAYVEVHQHRR